VYESFYGFREKPFNLTPDPKYLYLSRRHTEAFAHLEFGRQERGGFAVITGEVGTGKTTLARYFLARLGEKTATAVVLYPALTAAELLRSILDDLHVTPQGTSLKELVDALHRFLLQARAEGRDVVLLIDEAQDLSAEVLEQIRLISNLETDTEKLIQIVLMGQSELVDLLGRRELRQLAQRVSARYHLGTLSHQETEEYVRHRVRVAEGQGKVAFTGSALAAIHRLSGGVPRLINLVCDRALLAGYVQGTRTIDGKMVRRAAREVRGRGALWRASWTYGVLGVGAAAACAVAVLWLPGAVSSSAAARPVQPAEAPASSQAPPPLQAPPPTRAPQPPPPALEPLLLALPRGASFAGATDAVRALWGGDPLERTAFRTHLDQIRSLDLPVVLEMFHPARRDTCALALLRIEGSEAVVTAGGTPLRVPLDEVDRFWTRQAVFLWRDFDSMARARNPALTAAWARESLARLGYLRDGGADVPDAVTRFQHDAELAADGVIGSRTLMTLYSKGSYPRPRLTGGAS
jgi:general secretion pathway protein A